MDAEMIVSYSDIADTISFAWPYKPSLTLTDRVKPVVVKGTASLFYSGQYLCGFTSVS